MPTFQYSALDSQGVEVKDEIEALSQKEAISKIRNLGYFPTKVRTRGVVKKAATGAAPRKRRGAGGKVKLKAITQFARQLSFSAWWSRNKRHSFQSFYLFAHCLF